MKAKVQNFRVSYDIIDTTTQIVLSNGIAEISARNWICAHRKMQNSLNTIILNRVCAYFIDKYDITKKQFIQLYKDNVINLENYCTYKMEFMY